MKVELSGFVCGPKKKKQNCMYALTEEDINQKPVFRIIIILR